MNTLFCPNSDVKVAYKQKVPDEDYGYFGYDVGRLMCVDFPEIHIQVVTGNKLPNYQVFELYGRLLPGEKLLPTVSDNTLEFSTFLDVFGAELQGGRRLKAKIQELQTENLKLREELFALKNGDVPIIVEKSS